MSGPGRPPAGEPPRPPAGRLLGTLGGLAVAAGLGIALVHQWAEPRIAAHRAEELRIAIQEVLGAPDRYETLWVYDDGLRGEPPAGSDTAAAERVFAGYDAAGSLVGYAIAGEKNGYQDVIRLLFGYDPSDGRVLGMKVLESRETPGLGARITSDPDFIAEFEGVEPPLVVVKGETGEGPHEVDAITGATISSVAVVDIINERLAALEPLLRAGRRAEAAPGAARSAEAGPGATRAEGSRGRRAEAGDGS